MFNKIKSLWKKEQKVEENIQDGVKKPYYEPYATEGHNLIYNLLFADNEKLLNDESKKMYQAFTAPIFAEEFDLQGLINIVESKGIESRVKLLAYNRLREYKGVEIPKKILYGVVVEAHLASGLDTLAAYLDGEVRYINHTGRLVMINTPLQNKIEQIHSDDIIEVHMSKESHDETAIFEPYVHALFDASYKIVDNIGVWEEERLAPPSMGSIRFTFLCSDGLYFGQGTMEVVENDATIKPLFDASLALLTVVTNRAVKK